MQLNTSSLWKVLTPKNIHFPALDQNIEVDVAIVGGGITGLLTAYLLIQAGKKVAVLEKDDIAENTTGYSTGNLYVPVQPFYQNVCKHFNLETVKSVIQSRQAAIDFIERLVLEHKIECHFERRPWYLHTNDKNKIKFIEKEAEIFSKANCQIADKNLELPFAFQKAIRMDNQGRINPMKFTLQVASILKDKGCLIYENTPVLKFEETHDHCSLLTPNNKIRAHKIVLATHVPLGINGKQMLLGPYRSYVVAAKLEKNQSFNGNYWDVESPHHAISTHSAGATMDIDILAIAGRHHKTGQFKNTLKNFKELEKYLYTIFKIDKVEYHWSAQHYQSADSLPYIGLLSSNYHHIYMATGFFADGLVYGAVSSMIIADLMMHRSNLWHEVFDSTRFTPMASAPSFIKENSNVFIQYMKDFPGKCDTRSQKDIHYGEGKIIESKGEKIAAYRDMNGTLYSVSAVCTHMKGIVEWNSAEKTWDCPCHGSRFTPEGKVIEGPALKPLIKKELEK